jgi:hypothetical protein
MRVLIISPHFPPTNAADMQRVRLVLPHLRANGLEPEVLCVEFDQVAAPLDHWLEAGLPPDVVVHRVKALDRKWAWLPGLGILTYRALGALRRRGDKLLRNADFDLVYFSTTQFGLHVLGPRWRRKFGVPFVIDYQDPWVNDYYRKHPDVLPPGGRFKHLITDLLHRWQEPRVLKECSGITTVSVAYPQQLAVRYPWLRLRVILGPRGLSYLQGVSQLENGASLPISEPCRKIDESTKAVPKVALQCLDALLVPFPGDERDFERVKRDNIHQSLFDPRDGLRHWVYVGRGGADMALAVRAIFSALAESRPLNCDIRLHFIGTSYAAAGRGVKTIEPLAAGYGLQDIVIEHPDRIPYSETLRCLLDADALIVLGSNDSSYTASKIYPYLLARKPLLAVFHEASSVVDLMRNVDGGVVVAFETDESPEMIAARIVKNWILPGLAKRTVPLNDEVFIPYTARAQAKTLVEFLRSCLSGYYKSDRRP